MTDNNAGWIGPSQDGGKATAPPLDSPQYGPAWVADHYGTSHEQRTAALNEAGWTNNPSDRDQQAFAYARLLTAKADPNDEGATA